MPAIDLVLPALHRTQKIVKGGAARYNVIRCGRRWGKTTLGIDLALAVMLRGKPVGWFSPTYKSLMEVWRTMVTLLAPITVSKSEDEHRLVILGGGSIGFWSLSSGDNPRGRAYALVIIDEAAQVPDLVATWNMVIFPMLLDYVGGALILSTPKGLNGFYELHKLGLDPYQPDWKSFHFTTYDNPHIRPDQIDALKASMSEQAFRQEILAEFLESDSMVFRNLEAALLAMTTAPEFHQGHVIAAGGDWGKENDFTALSLGCKNCGQEVELDRFNELDWSFQITRLVGLHIKWRPVNWLLELNSIGGPQFEQVQRAGLPATGFITSNPSKKAAVEMLSLSLQQGWMKLLNDPVGKAELQSFERTRHANGTETYSAPPGQHDDTVIARMLMNKAVYDAPAELPQLNRDFDASAYMRALASVMERL